MARIILGNTDYFKATLAITAFPRCIYFWIRETTVISSAATAPIAGLFDGTGSGNDQADYVEQDRNSSTVKGWATDNNNWVAEGSVAKWSTNTWTPVLYMMDSATSRTLNIGGTSDTGTTSRTPADLNRIVLGIYTDTDDVNYPPSDGVWEIADFGVVPATPSAGEITDFITNAKSGKVVWPAGSYGGRSAEREHWDLDEAGDLNANVVGTFNSTALVPTGGPANATHPTLDYGGGGGGTLLPPFFNFQPSTQLRM